jgi:malonyl CoA-acyl carrier protein transacylase
VDIGNRNRDFVNPTFAEAHDSELQYLASPSSTLCSITVWLNEPNTHMVDVATLRDDKIRLLLNAVSSSVDIVTTVVLHIDLETYAVSDRQLALSWLGLHPRKRNASLLDADEVEYTNDLDVAVEAVTV